MFQRCHAVAGGKRCSRIMDHEGETHLLRRRVSPQSRLGPIQSAVNAFGHQLVSRKYLHFLFQSVGLLVLEIEVIVLNYPWQFLALPDMLQT